MPVMHLTTKASNQVWASPDGQRKIYELTMDYQGQPVKAKTYSDVIATVGWSGQAETYEKEGKPGMPSQTFVKQPAKEGGYSGSQGYKGKPQADPFTMYLSYAKDIAVGLIAAKGYTPERLSEIVAAVSLAGEQLYDSRPDGPTRQAEKTPEKPKNLNMGVPDNAPFGQEDEVHTVTDEPVDLSMVDRVFGAGEEPTQELPWPEPKA